MKLRPSHPGLAVRGRSGVLPGPCPPSAPTHPPGANGASFAGTRRCRRHQARGCPGFGLAPSVLSKETEGRVGSKRRRNSAARNGRRLMEKKKSFGVPGFAGRKEGRATFSSPVGWGQRVCAAGRRGLYRKSQLQEFSSGRLALPMPQRSSLTPTLASVILFVFSQLFFPSPHSASTLPLPAGL